jgi:phage/plasmid-associated DNA primase
MRDSENLIYIKSIESYQTRRMSIADLASQLHLQYCHVLKATSIKKNIWYEFKNHQWQLTDINIYLKNKRISLTATYSKVSLSKLVKECLLLFFDPKFVSQLDTDRTLIHFTNGIYDLKTDQLRDGQPSDRISLSTGYDYRPIDLQSEDYQSTQHLLLDLFESMEIKDYVLSCISTMLFGRKQPLINFLIGNQSHIYYLIAQLNHSLGQYAGIIDLPDIKNSSYQYQRELFEKNNLLRSTRILIININDSDNVKVSALKELACISDPIYYATPLYQDPAPRPLFRCLFNVEKLPSITIDDCGYWRRVNLLPFNPKSQAPTQPLSSLIFFHILIKYWQSTLNTTILKPTAIQTMIANYQSSNDYLDIFFKEELEVDPQSSLTLLEFY